MIGFKKKNIYIYIYIFFKKYSTRQKLSLIGIWVQFIFIENPATLEESYPSE